MRHQTFCVRVSGMPYGLDNPCDCGATRINELEAALERIVAIVNDPTRGLVDSIEEVHAVARLALRAHTEEPK